VCYFDGIVNLEGRHGTMSLEVSCKKRDDRRLVVVIRGGTNRDYRTSFDAVRLAEEIEVEHTE
jgi:hypothetical protein